MAAGGVLIAAAAMVGSMAGTAAASDWHDYDRVGHNCSSAMTDASTWQRVDGRDVWQGTRDASSCKRDSRWGWGRGNYGWDRGNHGWGHRHWGHGDRRNYNGWDEFLWNN